MATELLPMALAAEDDQVLHARSVQNGDPLLDVALQ